MWRNALVGTATGDLDLLFSVHSIHPYLSDDWLIATGGVPRRLRDDAWIYVRVDGGQIEAPARYVGTEER
jgi:hypothetical protein